MKWLYVFAAFIAIHLLAWGGAHWYFSKNPATELVVVDTSYSMKPSFPAMQSWLQQHEQSSRYRRIVVATDKAMIGDLADIKDRQIIFRTAFGRSQQEDLRPYQNIDASRRFLLSDGSYTVSGWTLIPFGS